MKKLKFFFAFEVPALVVLGFYLGGWWNFLAIGSAFIVLPLLDHIIGIDASNVGQDQAKIVGNQLYYRFVTYIWTFVQLSIVFWGAYVVATGMLLHWYEWAGFIIGFSLLTGGIGITVAHELGHKKSGLERFYSKLLLMTVCYMHFYIEHNRGHHVQVATLADPATARKNETVYSFWIRSVFTGYLHAWKLERKRLEGKGLFAFHFQNQMIAFTLLPLFFCALLTLLFSFPGPVNWHIPLFFFAQSVVAFTLLELVNYVEHYGILRKEKNGKPERVNPLHSWNSSHVVSNFFLFQLQRHSDHHANAIKRYQVLNHYDYSPQLPSGYPTMVMIALLPPLWFRLMNPRLEEWEGKVYH
ncbi:MAG TPA: alkane 1-monooxygenase [Cyclobacteriaceae bacterium]|nr:alkane 1-monooxygenase [Cyclobacteriaceae bacterium]